MIYGGDESTAPFPNARPMPPNTTFRGTRTVREPTLVAIIFAAAFGAAAIIPFLVMFVQNGRKRK